MKHATTLMGFLLLIGAVNSVPMAEPEDQGRDKTPLGTDEVPLGTDEVPLDTGEELQLDAEKVQLYTEEVPLDMDEDMDELPLDMEEQDPEEVPLDMDELSQDTEEVPPENSTMTDGENGAKPSNLYLKEVKKYFKLQSRNSHPRDARHSEGTINHGDTVALQTFVRSYWLGCPGRQCGRKVCPRMYMSGSDWNNCWGEVFRIYRASGPGIVRVGDLVGLYYPREAGRWMGCPHRICGTHTCPGHPTAAHGFASPDRWYRCWGEVFRIYVAGKANGAAINEYDDTSFYYIQERLWVSQGDHQSQQTWKRPCLGTSRPPTQSSYDRCAWEHFTIWKR